MDDAIIRKGDRVYVQIKDAGESRLAAGMSSGLKRKSRKAVSFGDGSNIIYMAGQEGSKPESDETRDRVDQRKTGCSLQ